MKAPFIIYADFEALIKKIPERERERTMASCTEKTDKHEACGFTFTVVRCDGKSWPVVKYRQGADGQKKAVEEPEFLDSVGAWDRDTGIAGKAIKRCFYKQFIGPKNKRKEEDPADKWIEKTDTDCLFCGSPLLRKNFRDSMKGIATFAGVSAGPRTTRATKNCG
ncbi:unnamed protein product [Porites lobata]|uniref:Uncharacterized protein n=1 Tax=Porites lobata TaxID=104759 RepID=A0ABN8Q616_9CNID|nr:unnamed protein product [Porites lobata]